MNDYDYCSKCHKVCDYLDLKPYNLKLYCNKCYIEEATEDPIVAGTSLYELCDYDYCSKCRELFDYLALKPYNLKWYCERCYKEVTAIDAITMNQTNGNRPTSKMSKEGDILPLSCESISSSTIT